MYQKNRLITFYFFLSLFYLVHLPILFHFSNKNFLFIQSKKIFEELIPDIKIGNISSSVVKNQFVITTSKTDDIKHNYEIREFSSGEKLIWYTAILLNYVKNIIRQ